MTRTWVAIALTACVGGLFSAPARADDAAKQEDNRIEIEIPVFAGGEGMGFYTASARRYEKIRPDVKVNIYGDPRMGDKIRVRVMEGDFPDAINVNMNVWPLIEHGDILALDPYLDKPNWEGDTTWRNSFVPGALDPYLYKGQNYGMPFSLMPSVIWYNPAIFKKHGWVPPKTWKEFFSLCETMKAAGVEPLTFQGRYPYYAEPIFASAYYGLAGLKPYQDFRILRPGSFDNPDAIKALAITQKFASYFEQGAWALDHTRAQARFLNGNVAMLPCGAWLKSEMLGKIPEGFKFASFNLPTVEGGVGDPKAINAFCSYFFVFKSSKHADETVNFLRFMTSRAEAGNFSKSRDIPTAVKGASKGNLSSDLADVATIIDQATLNYGHDASDVFIKYPEMLQYWDVTFRKVLVGEMSPEAAMKELEGNAATVLAKANNPMAVKYNHYWQPVVLIAVVLASLVFLGIMRLRDRRLAAAGNLPMAGGGKLSGMDFLRFVGPALLIYLVFVIVPSVRAFSWSVHSWNGLGGLGSMTWAGLLHFKRLLFEQDAFWIALKNNLFLMFVVPLFIIPISLLLAACLSRGIWGAKVFRVIFFFPSLLGTVAVALMWTQFYDPKGGLINGVLTRLGLHQFSGFTWLSAEQFHWKWLSDHFFGFDIPMNHLYWALIPMTVWGGCGFNMVLYLAAMQNVPEELYEAAEIEGASAWKQFWTITLPMIWDVLIVSVIFLIIAGMKVFDIVWLLTNQLPSTDVNVIGTRVVQTMFTEFNIGEATAMAVILFVLVFVGSATVMRLMQRETIEA